MYGNKVHEAVIAAGEKESGITIHYVDELYDHGNIIFQATCIIDDGETPLLHWHKKFMYWSISITRRLLIEVLNIAKSPLKGQIVLPEENMLL